MKCVALALLTAVAVGLSAPTAFALGGNHPEGQPTEQHRPEWPQGLATLANSEGRVQGHWVNANDFFYFRGDAAGFNDFVKRYGMLPEIDPTVILHVGKMPLTGPLGQEKSAPYNWKLEVYQRGWGAPVDPRNPEDDPGYRVTVHVWLNADMSLEDLKLPKHVDVRSGGEIEEFIDRHRRAE